MSAQTARLLRTLDWPRKAPLILEVIAGSRRPGGIQRLIVRVINEGESLVKAGRPAVVQVPTGAKPRTVLQGHGVCHVPARACLRYVLALPISEADATDAGMAYRLVIPRRPWGISSLDITLLIQQSNASAVSW